jgi:hypothetical protein
LRDAAFPRADVRSAISAFSLLCVAGWMNRNQQGVMEYFHERQRQPGKQADWALLYQKGAQSFFVLLSGL